MPHRPPQDVQEAAQRAERWIEDGKAGKGFTQGGDAGERWVTGIGRD